MLPLPLWLHSYVDGYLCRAPLDTPEVSAGEKRGNVLSVETD